MNSIEPMPSLDEYINELKQGFEKAISEGNIKMQFQYLAKLNEGLVKFNEAGGHKTFEHFSELYKDKHTHFIEEILQNARDVGATEVIFNLYQDKIIIGHNGTKLFDARNMEAICGIGKNEKAGDLNPIGRFGIGFKSVYAITEVPEIRSGQYNFKITKYIVPEQISSDANYNSEKTYFILPFKKEIVGQDAVLKEIENELTNIHDKLLFLTPIERVQWNSYLTEQICSGTHTREHIPDPRVNAHGVMICHSSNNERLNKSSYWLIFNKEYPIESGKQSMVEIAFRISKPEEAVLIEFRELHEEKENGGGVVYVYFPTDVNTKLNFIIQGPFRTTPARDNVPFKDAFNDAILESLGVLFSETVSKIKEMGALNPSFIEMLPWDRDIFSNESSRPFEIFWIKTIETFKSVNNLLPISSREGYNHVSSETVAITSDEWLLNNLDSLDIKYLFNKEHWLSERINSDTRDMIACDLEVAPLTIDDFIIKLDKSFLIGKNDDWIIKLYDYLNKKSNRERNTQIRQKPIVRVNDEGPEGQDSRGQHGQECPYDSVNNKPRVYLPSTHEIKGNFILVKNTILVEETTPFLKECLGLTVLDDLALIENIMEKYPLIEGEFELDELNTIINDCIKDTEDIIRLLNQNALDNDDYRNKRNSIQSFRFIIGTNHMNKCRFFTPTDVYLNKKYTNEDILDVFFKENDSIWWLSDHYAKFSKEILTKLGCIDKLDIKEGSRLSGIFHEGTHYQHYRPCDDKFHIEMKMDGLDYALENIDFERSKIIWAICNKRHDQISGKIRCHNQRQALPGAIPILYFSVFGRLLRDYPWLPDKNFDLNNPTFYKPKEIKIKDLHTEFLREEYDIERISIALGFMEPDFLGGITDPREREVLKRCLQIMEKQGANALDDMIRDNSDPIIPAQTQTTVKPPIDDNTDDEILDEIAGPPLPGPPTLELLDEMSNDNHSEHGESYQHRAKRLQGFRKCIRYLYENKCAICSQRVYDFKGNPAIDAAHIQPLGGDYGPDSLKNGISLCKLHHWAFDRGLFSINDDYSLITKPIPSDEMTTPNDNNIIYDLNGKKLSLPIPVKNKEGVVQYYNPDKAYLQYHRKKYGYE